MSRGLAPALLLLAACKGASEPPGECLDAGDCAGIAVCDEDRTCRTVECTTSEQCPLGTHCEAQSNACFTGCAENGDCLSGEVCDVASGSCVAGTCRDTEVDCWIGQTCLPETGACALLDGQCASCDGNGWSVCENEHGGECRYIGSETYCLLPCDPAGSDAAERPRAFTCTDIGWSTSPEWVWWGDCTKTEEIP